ncbi:MAG: hypothetical protein R3B36_25500 [Polyangiaceae bacterium]
MVGERWGVGFVCAVCVALASSSASAAEPKPARVPPSAPDGSSPDVPAVPPPGDVAQDAPAAPPAPAPLPSRTPVVEPPSTEPCALAVAAGVDPVDAQTAAELVCASVLEDSPGAGVYRVKVSRLDRVIVLSLVRIHQGRRETKSLVVRNLEETPLAAPRLVAAIRARETPSETATVENVVSTESQAPKRKGAVASGFLGLTAVSAVNASMQTRGGIDFGASFGSARTRFVLSGRLVGESLMAPISAAATVVSLGLIRDSNRTRVEGALGTGALGISHYLSVDDTSPFVGAGMGLAYLAIQSNQGVSVSGTGVLPYAELGLALLRTHAFGAQMGLRLDVPTFSLQGIRPGPLVAGKPSGERVSAWPVLASFFLSARF